MTKPCGLYFGHEECGYVFAGEEIPTHTASNDSWTRTKNPKYRNKMIKQQKKKK